MSEEVPLIRRSPRGNGYQYSICAQGVFLLKALKSKKLRIIFNITHEQRTLHEFNQWFFNSDSHKAQEGPPNACLTISKKMKDISEDRVIIILTAYQCCEPEPFMVLLGYLGASVFLYHHFDSQVSVNSKLTILLAKLWALLSDTDINQLNSELSHSKGYAKNPYFLCLLSQQQNPNKFDQIYRCNEQNVDLLELNKAIDTLIDYFPMRRAHSMALDREAVAKIGFQFQNSILGRTVFNFEFTGGTLQNLCYDCCQAFNSRRTINLHECYMKIIQNQKARLEGESMEHMMCELSNTFFFGAKLDLHGENCFPLASYDLLRKYKAIQDEVIVGCLKSATSCMTLAEYCQLQTRLRKALQDKLKEFEEANAWQANSLCSECYGLLDSISDRESTSDNLYVFFQQMQRNLQLFRENSCQELARGDPIQTVVWQEYNMLVEKYLNNLEEFTREVVGDLIIQSQTQKLDIEKLKYDNRTLETQLRDLQRQYQIQGEVLNQTKCKLLCENDSVDPPQAYTFETNKLRRKFQELQEQVKDKNLHIEELESILERIDGTYKDKDKTKFKFSKEIQDLMKDISQKVNTYYQVVREAKQTSELEEELKKRFAKQRAAIQEQKNQIKTQISRRDSEIQRLRTQKLHLEQTLEESRHAIAVLKSSSRLTKESINNLQRNCAQLNCVLAQTQHQLQYYKKGLLLIGEQQVKGVKSDKLSKFCNTCSIEELRELLRPFVLRK